MSANAGEKISGWGLVAVLFASLVWLALYIFLLPKLALSETAANGFMALSGFVLCASILLIRYRKATWTMRLTQIGLLAFAIPLALLWLKLPWWTRWMISVIYIALAFVSYLKWVNRKNRGEC